MDDTTPSAMNHTCHRWNRSKMVKSMTRWIPKKPQSMQKAGEAVGPNTMNKSASSHPKEEEDYVRAEITPTTNPSSSKSFDFEFTLHRSKNHEDRGPNLMSQEADILSQRGHMESPSLICGVATPSQATALIPKHQWSSPPRKLTPQDCCARPPATTSLPVVTCSVMACRLLHPHPLSPCGSPLRSSCLPNW